jgi:hypothetical protein
VVVHHFTAPDLVVAEGWQPMDTFPKDGTIVEIKDIDGVICKAQWHSERILPASLKIGEPMFWREI